MLSHSMYSPLRSLHRSMRIFHCWKQCCRSSSDSLFMSSVAFAFTASMDSNIVPFNADLIFEKKKKNHMGLGQVSTVEVPTRWSCASSKTSWQTGRCVPARFLGEEPMSRSSTFQDFSSHPLKKVCQNLLVVDLVNALTFRHPIHVNNPSDVEKKIIIALNLDLLCRVFFCLGELGLFQCRYWRVLSGSYWKKKKHN